MKPWQVLSARRVMQDRFMGLRTERCQREDGHVIEAYHIIELTDWVTLVPVTDTGNIVLIREYRHAAGEVFTGLPGGVADPGERDWAAAGARELREETGYVAREMTWLGTCYPNPATQNNRLHYYLATGCERTAVQQLDPNEEIEVLEMPYAEFLEYGALAHQHALHAAALFYAEQYFRRNPSCRPGA